MNLEERVRERLNAVVGEAMHRTSAPHLGGLPLEEALTEIVKARSEAVDTILREFAVRPISQGVVDAESGEVRPTASRT